jgi:hypothetical protein
MRKLGHLPALATPLAERQAKMGGDHEEFATGGVNNSDDGPAGFPARYRDVVDFGLRHGSAAQQHLAVVAIGCGNRRRRDPVVAQGAIEESERMLAAAQAARVNLLQGQDVGIGPADECQDPGEIASTGIGYELAKCCAENGFDLVVAADEAEISKSAKDFEAMGAKVDAVNADLATIEGVDRLCEKVGRRPVDALLANAGRGLGKGFLDQDFDEVMRVVNTNITGTIYLIQKSLATCRRAGRAASSSPADRRVHARHLPGGLQRQQGFPRLVLIRAARGR